MRIKTSSLIIGILYTIFASLVTLFIGFADYFDPNRLLDYKDGLYAGLLIVLTWVLFLILWNSLIEKDSRTK